ncbi:aminotransferase class I/II-fold pyridoxal phosphate-dependent enzyme [Pseudomonadota bacterium]
MSKFTSMSQAELQAQQVDLQARYDSYKAQGLKLDMTRGLPSKAQLDLAAPLLELPGRDGYQIDGIDGRNYGGLDGLPEVKALFADYLAVSSDEVIVGGNSSLSMMYDALLRAMYFGVQKDAKPWRDYAAVKFLCPVPGYDRHFRVTEHLGFELVNIDMLDDGPDLGQIEDLVAEDETIKGIWCVPRYSNPTGAVYSDETVDRLAKMKTAAADFRIIWDDAYAVHHITENPPVLKNILQACKDHGQPDRVLMFASTSKITFAGAGLAAMAGSVDNMNEAKKHLFVQTIGPDKINQLRHLLFFKNLPGINRHMQNHRDIVKPKFDMVQSILHQELDGTGTANWTNPQGGYFVSLDTPDGCAHRVVELASDVGVKLTEAGATFPYGKDPSNRNLRIAPTFPPIGDIEIAMGVLGVCVKLAAIEQQGR